MSYSWMKVLIISACVFATSNIFAKDVVSWKKVVPEAKRIGVLTHRYYPAIFKDGVKRTHFGVDILGSKQNNNKTICGKPIYPLLPGYVVAIGTGYNRGLGNAVLMRHPDRTDGGGDLYTIYLHMENKPDVEEGEWMNSLSPIGYVGAEGFTGGICHVHFEIRNFFHDSGAGGYGWFHEKLRGIYATGDYSNKSWVLNDWEDPDKFYVSDKVELTFIQYKEPQTFIFPEYSIEWHPETKTCHNASKWLENGKEIFDINGRTICKRAYDELLERNWVKYVSKVNVFFGEGELKDQCIAE